MRRPLAGVLTGFAGGILLGHFHAAPPAWLWGLTVGLGALLLLWNRAPAWLVWPLLVLAGWANLLTATGVISPDDLRKLLPPSPVTVVVRGCLAEPPQIKISERKQTEVERSMTAMDVTSIRQEGNWRPAVGRVMIETAGDPDDRFFRGQSVEITGLMAPPSRPLADGLFDYRTYLAEKGIYFLLTTTSTNDWRLGPGARVGLPPTQRFLNWAKTNLARGLPAVDEPLKLIWAMALGWRTAFTGDVSDPFLQAGTMHLFAIDGLRIALVSGIVITLLRVFRLPRAVSGFTCIPILWFYTAATGWEPSAIRASLMMTIVIGGWAWHRPGDLLNSLAAAALIILAADPAQMFAAGFQLSFLVVLVIALMLPPLDEAIDNLCQFDPLVPIVSVPRWRLRTMETARLSLRWLALSLTAWVGSIPLSAKYFHLFSPISILANVVAVPLGMGALAGIMGSLVCGTWLPWLTILFNHSAWFFMVAMTLVSEWATTLPGAYIYVSEPSWPAIALYYLLLVAGLNDSFGFTKKAFARLVALAALITAVAVWLWAVQGPHRATRLTVLPLSGSQVICVDGGNATNRVLINCGDAAAVDSTLKPFLRAQGINRVARLILTTGAVADVGGARQLRQILPVDQMYASPINFRSPAYRDVLAAFDRNPPGHGILYLGDTIAGWTVLHPSLEDHWPSGDDNALVLRGSLGHTTLLLLADLGRNGQSALLGRTNSLRADIVISSLPAKGEALCNDLIAAVRPRLIIIVDAEFPVTRRAGAALKKRLAANGIPVIYTRNAGAVTILPGQDEWEVAAMDGQSYRFTNTAN